MNHQNGGDMFEFSDDDTENTGTDRITTENNDG